MFIKYYKIFYLIFSLTILNLKTTEATKCGEFSCEGNSECRYNKEMEKLQCACEEGYEASIEGNIYNCQKIKIKHQIFMIQCPNAGDHCGPNHKCNQDLVCEEIHEENKKEIEKGNPYDFICNANEELCLERCCHENEICQKGKCVLREEALNNEVILNNDCPEFQKCANKCCAATEECHNHNQCIAKAPALNDCPKELICLESCCLENEFCDEENKCVALDESEEDDAGDVEILLPASLCPEAQQCRHKCCAETEKCVNEGECVPQELVAVNCPKHRQCLGKCCSDTEICKDNNKCVPRSTEWLKCPEIQRCGDNCCPIKHICNEQKICETIQQVSIPVLSSLSHGTVVPNCPLAQICSDICCTAEQKCSKTKECIPIDTIECYETDICGDKCCPINETCNENHQCVAFLENPPVENCPPQQICLDQCCSPPEVCNEFDECVIKIMKKEEPKHVHNMEDHEMAFDSVVPLYDFENIEMPIICPEDHNLCQTNCCNLSQRCTENGECLALPQQEVIEKNCNLENCVEKLSNKDTMASLAYTLIGLGSLVMVLSFALFKVYVFRRTNRNVF